MSDKGFESKASINFQESTNESSKIGEMPHPRNSLGRRQFLKLGAAALITAGSIKGLSYLSGLMEYKPQKVDLSSFGPPKDLGENQASRKKLEEVEQKYNINIFSVGEAREYVAQNFDSYEFFVSLQMDKWQETDQVFSMDQLKLLDDMFANLPKRFYAPVNNKKYTIILRGNDFGNAGETYGETGMIGLGARWIDPSNKEESFSLLVHESMHRQDGLFTGEEIDTKTWAILKEQSYLKLKDLSFADRNDLLTQTVDPLKDGTLTKNDKVGALLTLKSFDQDRYSFSEGIAGFAQRYVTGYERFMRAFGPLLDGDGYDDDASENLSVADFISRYPRSQALYALYKAEIFDGKEYDKNTLNP